MRPSATVALVLAELLASLLLTAAAAAQIPSPTGSLFGQVLDEQGKSLPDITVTLTGPGATQASTTNTHGDFHFLNLSPGAYSATLERKGFETVRRDVTVVLGKNSVLSITMRVAGAEEAVTVSGQAPLLDSRKTETGATFGQEELRDIPTTRDPWAILRQVPGVLLADLHGTNAQQSGFVGKGSHSDQNSFNLDGVGITDRWGGLPVDVDFDSLDSIAVATGGSDPALATPGVTLNLVTKRGTNGLLGSARGLFTEGAGWDYGAEAGGPAWRDHVWLWGAAASNAFPGQNLVTANGEPVQLTNTVNHWNAKLNAQLAAANSLALSFVNSSTLLTGDGAGPNRAQLSTWDTESKTTAYRVEDSDVVSAKLFASLYFSHLSIAGTATPQGGDQQADNFDDVWENSFAYYGAKRPQHQAGLTVSGFFDTGDLRHEIKFGFGYRQMQVESTSSWPGGGLMGWSFSSIAGIPENAAVMRPSNLRAVTNTFSSYAGDTIQADRLTVSVGARFDYQQGKNLPSSVPANPFFPDLLPAVHYPGDSGYPITWRQFQPRVGATYAVGSNRKTLLRGSYSRFANRLGEDVFQLNAFPGPGELDYYWDDTNGNRRVEPNELVDADKPPLAAKNVDPSNPGSAIPVNQIANDLKPPVTDEWIAGVEREILSDLSASVAYTHRSVRNLEFAPLIGTSRSSYRYIGNATGVATAGGFALPFSEPYYGLTTDPPPNGVEIQNRPDFTQTYNGVEFQIIKQLSHGWMLRASFAYNDWQQKVGPGAIVDPNNIAGGSNVSGPVLEGTGNQYGRVFINATWQFNVSGMIELPLGIAAGANLFGRQGFPIVYSVLAVTRDTKYSLPEIQIGQVDAYRGPNVFVLDLHIERPFRIGSMVTISPVLDCFNVANSHTVLQRNGVVGIYDAEATPAFTPWDFNQPAELLSNRTFRGGVRISF